MSASNVTNMPWAEHAADRSPMVQRYRLRSVQQMRVLVEAAKRLIDEKGNRFTTQELVKEAGVAMQTFYRHFAGKDHLLIAVIEDLTTEQVALSEEATRDLPDPLVRLRHHVMATLTSLDASGKEGTGPRFVTAEHWRLHQLHPEDMAHATQSFTDLTARELRAAQAAGLVTSTDIDGDAALVTKLVTAVYHHYAFAKADKPAELIAEKVWAFCLGGIGGKID